MSKILLFMRTVWLGISRPFRKTYTTNICGHSTKKKDRVGTGKNTYTLEMPLAENGKPDYCHDCLDKMAIRCAWCGESIYIGDPVTLLAPEKSFTPPKYAVKYQDNPQCLVGCLRWNCTPTAALRSGFWHPPGKVKRVLSPLELCAAGAAMVIVGDISDPNNIGEISIDK